MAGVKVDRYLKQLPERFFNERGQLTQEGEEWFEYDNRWKQAVWSKLGGTDDFVDSDGNIVSNALLTDLVNKSTSGDALTFDTTGFTWDSSVIFFDETEA